MGHTLIVRGRLGTYTLYTLYTVTQDWFLQNIVCRGLHTYVQHRNWFLYNTVCILANGGRFKTQLE